MAVLLTKIIVDFGEICAIIVWYNQLMTYERSHMKHDIRTVDYNMSLEEIGEHLGLTRERVRQIQNEALVKLKNGLMERGYTAQDFLQVLGMKADADSEEFICNLRRTKDQ